MDETKRVFQTLFSECASVHGICGEKIDVIKLTNYLLQNSAECLPEEAKDQLFEKLTNHGERVDIDKETFIGVIEVVMSNMSSCDNNNFEPKEDICCEFLQVEQMATAWDEGSDNSRDVIMELQLKHVKLNDDYCSVKTLLDRANNEIDNLTQASQSEAKVQERLREQQKLLKGKVEALSTENDRLNNELQQKNDITEEEKWVENNLRKQKQKFENELLISQNEQEQLAQSLSEFKNNFEIQSRKVCRLTDLLQEKNETLTVFEQTLVEIQQSHKDLEQRLKVSNDEKEAGLYKISQLNDQLLELNKIRSKFISQLSSVQLDRDVEETEEYDVAADTVEELFEEHSSSSIDEELLFDSMIKKHSSLHDELSQAGCLSVENVTEVAKENCSPEAAANLCIKVSEQVKDLAKTPLEETKMLVDAGVNTPSAFGYDGDKIRYEGVTGALKNCHNDVSSNPQANPQDPRVNKKNVLFKCVFGGVIVTNLLFVLALLIIIGNTELGTELLKNPYHGLEHRHYSAPPT